MKVVNIKSPGYVPPTSEASPGDMCPATEDPRLSAHVIATPMFMAITLQQEIQEGTYSRSCYHPDSLQLNMFPNHVGGAGDQRTVERECRDISI
jgi:PAS domain-containing serine/threonine kinase